MTQPINNEAVEAVKWTFRVERNGSGDTFSLIHEGQRCIVKFDDNGSRALEIVRAHDAAITKACAERDEENKREVETRINIEAAYDILSSKLAVMKEALQKSDEGLRIIDSVLARHLFGEGVHRSHIESLREKNAEVLSNLPAAAATDSGENT